MQTKKFAMLLAAGCVIGLMTGCVKQEEYDAKVTELNTKYDQKVAELNASLDEKDATIKEQGQKLRAKDNEIGDLEGQRDDAKKEAQELGQTVAQQKSKMARLESDLKSQTSLTSSAKARASKAEDKCASLEAELELVQRRFADFRKNMEAMNNPAPAPAVEEAMDIAGPASASDKGAAGAMLEEMSGM